VQQEITSGAGANGKDAAPLAYSRYATSFGNQVFQITKRFATANSRNVAVMMSRYGTTTVTAIIGGILFYHAALNQKGASNRVALMTISAVFPIFGAMAPIPDLVSSRPLYFREKNSQMYSPFAYYLGRMFGDQPFILIEGILWSLIIYFMVKMPSVMLLCCTIAHCITLHL
jgi:ATP-binding cassette subfamily G (WHITE) protein 2 (SNQ2)